MKKLFALPLLLLAMLSAFAQVAPTVTQGSPVVTTNADGSSTLVYSTTVKIPAPATIVVPPVVVIPPVATPTIDSMVSGLLGSTGGYVPQLWPWPVITTLPVNTAIDTAWKAEYTVPSGDGIHIDTTMKYVVGSATAANMTTVSKWDSPVGVDNVPYPVTATTPATYLEDGKAITTNPTGDRHFLYYNKANSKLYELYQPRIISGKLLAYAGRVWDLTRPMPQVAGRNSTDAAGLPVAPLLLNYDEVLRGAISHPLRMTMNASNSSYIPPATHAAGGGDSAYMGMTIRLKATVDITKFSKANQVILTALRTYGAIDADNGSNMYISATSDTRWNQDDLAALHVLTESDFEVVDTGMPVAMPQ